MSEILGTLAADFYIAKVTSCFIDSAAASKQSLFETWGVSSRAYLANLLMDVNVDKGALTKVPTTSSISPKVECLVRILCSHHKGDSGSRGIVFVTERVTTVVVHHLLSPHRSIKQLFRIGSVVESSKHHRGRQDLGDIFSTAEQSKVIERFPSGEINHLVVTSVLEEGIDVSACNLVVCFDPPLSTRSFIQRRGGARKAGSEYISLTRIRVRRRTTGRPLRSSSRPAEYDRKDRTSAISNQAANRETSDRVCIEPTTGAVIDMENANGRLQHFCAVAGTRRYADKQPYFLSEELKHQPPSSDDIPPLLEAKAILPAFVSYHLRTTGSKQAWHSERNASKDAAFEAYMRLYRAGCHGSRQLAETKLQR